MCPVASWRRSTGLLQNWMPRAAQYGLKRRGPRSWVTAAQARRQLDFYLVEHRQRFRELMGDPWSYAIYHCGTAANIYSPVHWSYFPGFAPPRHLNPAKQSGAEEMTMKITTGQKLASSLRHDDNVQIDKDDAEVHHAYSDQDGKPRICRPSLFSVKEDRSWRVSAETLPGQPCEACNR